MMEAIRSSETSVLTRVIQRNNPEDGILHSHCREYLKSYISILVGIVSNPSDLTVINIVDVRTDARGLDFQGLRQKMVVPLWAIVISNKSRCVLNVVVCTAQAAT
jgi:hypothetical protein